MKRFLPLLVVLAVACPGGPKTKKVSLESVAGGYTVEGTNPDGSKYKGTMVLTENDGLFDISGSIQATGQSFKGIGLLMDDVLAISYSIQLADKPGEMGDLNLTVYKVKSDGRLEGNWSYEGGTGKEIAKKIR